MLSDEHYGVANFRKAGRMVVGVDVIHAVEGEEKIELIRLDEEARSNVVNLESEYEDGVVVGYAATPRSDATDTNPIRELVEIRYNPENGEWWVYDIHPHSIEY
jgi:hypothetical protein